MKFDLNSKNARDVGKGGFINQPGLYIGQFIRAEEIKSIKGTTGIEFDFLDDSGMTANFLSVWAVNDKGDELHGRKIIDGIMTCLKVRSMEPQRGVVKKRDQESREVRDQPAMLYAPLMGKRVGVVLTTEDYQANDGTIKTKMVLVAPFDADTRRMPGEVLDNKPAEQLDRLLSHLKHRPYKPRPGAATVGGAPKAAAGGSFDDMDDDIPF